MSQYSENSVNVGIPLKNMTGKTVDISKYLDFGFNEKVCIKYNDILSPSWWLGIIQHTYIG